MWESQDFPPPTTDPDTGPFITVRFASGWLPYLLGALLDSLDNNPVWEGEGVTDDTARQRVMLLAELLQTPTEFGPMATPAAIHPYALSVVGGTWTRQRNAAVPHEPVIFTTTAALGNEVKFRQRLLPGVYEIRLEFTKWPSAGQLNLIMDDGEGYDVVGTADMYSAATLHAQQALWTVEILAETETDIRFVITDSPTSPGSTYGASFSWISVARVG